MMDMEASLIPERQGNTSELQNIYQDKKQSLSGVPPLHSYSGECFVNVPSNLPIQTKKHWIRSV